MPWNRPEPDPLENRRRQLAEQERLLSEERRRLTEQLQKSMESTAKRAEPLVWRSEEEGQPDRSAEPTPARRRNLARQRQRDKIRAFVFVVFLVVVGIVLWVAYLHTTAPGT